MKMSKKSGNPRKKTMERDKKRQEKEMVKVQ
jgi:hypothetical protein